MRDDTHPLLGTQRTVRAIRKVAASIARSEIAASKRLATVQTVAPSNATLTTALVSGTAYTSLAVTALRNPIASGANVVLVSGSDTQTFVASAAAAAGATSISVNSLAANFAYPVGTLADPTVFTILVDGTSTAIPAVKLDAYSSPAVNDRVLVESFGRQIIVLGTYG